MIIATRVFQVTHKTSNYDVNVGLFAPEMLDGQWICQYEIDWPENKRSSFAAGIDAIQAIYLAMQKIGIDLYMSDYHAAGELVWNRPGDGYGFPVPKNGRDFLIGSDKTFDGP